MLRRISFPNIGSYIGHWDVFRKLRVLGPPPPPRTKGPNLLEERSTSKCSIVGSFLVASLIQAWQCSDFTSCGIFRPSYCVLIICTRPFATILFFLTLIIDGRRFCRSSAVLALLLTGMCLRCLHALEKCESLTLQAITPPLQTHPWSWSNLIWILDRVGGEAFHSSLLDMSNGATDNLIDACGDADIKTRSLLKSQVLTLLAEKYSNPPLPKYEAHSFSCKELGDHDSKHTHGAGRI